jgi:hypothetical protein
MRQRRGKLVEFAVGYRMVHADECPAIGIGTERFLEQLGQ